MKGGEVWEGEVEEKNRLARGECLGPPEGEALWEGEVPGEEINFLHLFLAGILFFPLVKLFLLPGIPGFDQAAEKLSRATFNLFTKYLPYNCHK